MVPYLDALKDAAIQRGISFEIVSGYRTPAEQAELARRFKAGDPSVVYPPARHSFHLRGLAVDISSNGLTFLGEVAESLGMRWGGRFGDPVHFDLGRK